eukprot:TRINITY_DN472_c1_g1_i9.p2 TRINITY_DN472_c1_g1~~TRINITY_DN472_c1_g1_i9.p2  ORF type:complete len:180 (-),score=18.85 TRINITY_DN472_c1_g1_i9:45-584(-)
MYFDPTEGNVTWQQLPKQPPRATGKSPGASGWLTSHGKPPYDRATGVPHREGLLRVFFVIDMTVVAFETGTHHDPALSCVGSSSGNGHVTFGDGVVVGVEQSTRKGGTVVPSVQLISGGPRYRPKTTNVGRVAVTADQKMTMHDMTRKAMLRSNVREQMQQKALQQYSEMPDKNNETPI